MIRLFLALALLLPGLHVAAETDAAAEDKSRFHNWIAKCEASRADQQGGCFIIQDLVLREGGQRVLQVAIGYVPGDHDPIVALSLPLGMSLPGGVRMEVPGTAPMHFAVERCEPSGCRAGARLAPEFLTALAQGEKLTVQFNDAKREPIEVPVSLAGFADGLAAIRARSVD